MTHLVDRGDARPSSLPLLAACGLAFAVRIMLSKAALDAGASPFQIGTLGSLGAALILAGMLWRRGEGIPREPRHLVLYAVLGVVSVALPTVLSFFVVRHVGPGYAATVYCLSPLLTMSLAAGVGLESLSPRRSAGILVGLLGMLAMVQQQVVAIDLGRPAWVLAGLLVPAFAALGNVIRSALWPPGTSALAFSCATLLVSSLVMAGLAMLFEDPSQWRMLDPGILLVTVGFVLVSALSTVLNFNLQQAAGPVVFSQIGTWGTGFGILLAALVFRDMPTALSGLGLAAVVWGGTLANRRSQVSSPERPAPA